MANTATGQPSTGVVQVPNTSPNPSLVLQTQQQSYKSILNPSFTSKEATAAVPIFELHHGEPSFLWEDKDVENMVMSEDLQYVVVGKFAYGMPEFQDLKKQIPLQLELKGACCIGLLDSRHILIKLSILEDYVHILSRPAFYIKIGYTLHQMRGLKYEVWFDPNEETSIGVAWVSFPGLPPVFFGKETVFSLARAIGRPLQVDAATKAKSRPSCAKVKVELDLLATRPQQVRIGIKNSTTGEARFKWVRIRYDYVPKYCKECRLQGHCDSECFVLHPELVKKNDFGGLEDEAATVEPVRILKSGKVVGNVEPTQPTQKNSDGNLVAAHPSRGRSNPKWNGGRVLHPNKNPNAWVRVDTKKKYGQEATRQVEGVPSTTTNCVTQEETITTRNAFDLLENIVEVPDKDINLNQQTVEEKSLEQDDVDLFVQKEKESQVPIEMQENQAKTLNMSVANPVANQQGLQTREWVEVAFKNHPNVNEVGVSSVSGKLVDESRVAVESQGGSLVLVSQPSACPSDVGRALDIPASSGFIVAQQPVALVHEAEKYVHAARCDAACLLDMNMKMFDAFNVGESRGEFVDVEQLPSAAPKSFKSHAEVVSQAIEAEGFNIYDIVGQLPSALIPSENGNIPSQSPCGINKLSDVNVVESREEVEPSASSFDSRGSAFIIPAKPRNDAASDLNASQSLIGRALITPAAAAGVNDSQVDVGEQLAQKYEALDEAAIDCEGERALDFFAQPPPIDATKDTVRLEIFYSPSAAAGTPLLGATASVLDISENDDANFSQRTCVENKQALVIPSLEVSTTLESVSVTKPKFFGKDIIPTAQLERLCRSASPNFGKSFLNINAPSYVPKSLMQLVPHSKHLPTDDELVKRMDLNDTTGILARQVGSFQQRVPQGHYLVEDDDSFDDVEFEEESIAHNFSMVAREGDLSPREIHDNAPKRVRRVRRPLEPTRVQPTRSTKSKSKRSKKSKK